MSDEVSQDLYYLAFDAPVLPSELLEQRLHYFLFKGFLSHLG
jgi:hypothetical protein